MKFGYASQIGFLNKKEYSLLDTQHCYIVVLVELFTASKVCMYLGIAVRC